MRDNSVEIAVNIFNSIQCELAEQFSANLANESISIPSRPGQWVKLNELPAIREIKLANLPVNLIQPPASTIQLPAHLPRLAARTINLPVHAIKLAAHLTRLPIHLLHLPASIFHLPLRVASLTFHLARLPPCLARLAAQISPLPVQLTRLSLHLACLPVRMARLPVHISCKNPCFSGFSWKLPPMSRKMPLDCADMSAL